MEQTQIARLFGLFAGDDTLGETYGAVLETAVLDVYLWWRSESSGWF